MLRSLGGRYSYKKKKEERNDDNDRMSAHSLNLINLWVANVRDVVCTMVVEHTSVSLRDKSIVYTETAWWSNVIFVYAWVMKDWDHVPQIDPVTKKKLVFGTKISLSFAAHSTLVNTWHFSPTHFRTIFASSWQMRHDVIVRSWICYRATNKCTDESVGNMKTRN